MSERVKKIITNPQDNENKLPQLKGLLEQVSKLINLLKTIQVHEKTRENISLVFQEITQEIGRITSSTISDLKGKLNDFKKDAGMPNDLVINKLS